MNNLPSESSKDKKLQALVASILRIGVLTSICLALMGFTSLFISEGIGYGLSTQFLEFNPQPFSCSSFITGFTYLHYSSFLLLGIIVLILTPILRVVFAIIGFKMQGDRLYVRVGLIVLCIIVASIIYGNMIA